MTAETAEPVTVYPATFSQEPRTKGSLSSIRNEGVAAKEVPSPSLNSRQHHSVYLETFPGQGQDNSYMESPTTVSSSSFMSVSKRLSTSFVSQPIPQTAATFNRPGPNNSSILMNSQNGQVQGLYEQDQQQYYQPHNDMNGYHNNSNNHYAPPPPHQQPQGPMSEAGTSSVLYPSNQIFVDEKGNAVPVFMDTNGQHYFYEENNIDESQVGSGINGQPEQQEIFYNEYQDALAQGANHSSSALPLAQPGQEQEFAEVQTQHQSQIGTSSPFFEAQQKPRNSNQPIALVQGKDGGLDGGNKQNRATTPPRRRRRICCCFQYWTTCIAVFVFLLIILGVLAYLIFPGVPTWSISDPFIPSTSSGLQINSTTTPLSLNLEIAENITVYSPSYFNWAAHSVGVLYQLKDTNGTIIPSFQGNGLIQDLRFPARQTTVFTLPIDFVYTIASLSSLVSDPAIVALQGCLQTPPLKLNSRVTITLDIAAISWLGIKPVIPFDLQQACPAGLATSLGGLSSAFNL